MSAVFDLRDAVKNLLLGENLWSADEVIIKRRTDIWNDVATSIAASKSGQCIVVGLLSGGKSDKQRQGSRNLIMNVTMAISIVEVHNLADPQTLLDASDEDTRFEATLMRLHGSSLGRSAITYTLDFDTFAEQEDEQYLIRQATFKTELTLKPNT